MLLGDGAGEIQYLEFFDKLHSEIYNGTEISTGAFTLEIDDFFNCGSVREYQDK